MPAPASRVAPKCRSQRIRFGLAMSLAVAMAGVLCVASSAAADDSLVAQKNPLVLTEPVRIRCVGLLREALKSGLEADPKSEMFWPAMHAAEALTASGHQAEVLAQLTPRLADEPDGRRRCGLARELVRAGDPKPVGVLLTVLESAEVSEQINAAESLYKIREMGDGKLLRRTMEHCSSPVGQLMAAGALVQAGDAEPLKRIRAGLAAEDPDTRRIAAWLLARLGDKSDIARLAKNIKDERDDVAKNYSYLALAFLGDIEGQAALERNLANTNVELRSYAAEAAGHTKSVLLAPKLIKLLDDPELDVRVRAAQSLLMLSKP